MQKRVSIACVTEQTYDILVYIYTHESYFVGLFCDVRRLVFLLIDQQLHRYDQISGRQRF